MKKEVRGVKEILVKSLFFLLSITIVSCGTTKTVVEKDDNVVKTLKESEEFDFQYAFIEANKQMMLGNYEKAKALFMKCLKINDTDPAIHYKLGTIALYEKKFEEAQLFAESSVNINPENEWYNILLATVYEQLNKIEDAKLVYKKLVKNNPENPQYYIELAILNQNNKDYEEAIKVYNSIESAFGISESISLEKEKLYHALGRPKEAKNEIVKLNEFFPEDTRYIGLLADYYMQEDKPEEAKKLYDKILSIEPGNGIVRISLATYYYDLGQFEKAYENLKSAFENKNLESAIKTNIILSVLEGKNKLKLTAEMIEELSEIIIEIHPKDYNARLLYSDILIQKQDFVNARDELKFISKEIKDRYILWEQLLLIENQLLDFEGMFKTSTEAIEYFPNQAMLYLLNGIAGLQTDRYEEARESLTFGSKLVTSNDPQKLQFYTYIAEANYNLNKYDEAFEYFEKVLEIDPENILVLNNYAYYLSELNQNLDKALEMSKITIEKENLNPTYLDTYAWILFKMENYDEAKLYMEKALKNGGITNATLMDHYGDILFKLGNIQEALDTWNRAYELEPNENIKEKIDQKKIIE